MLHKYEKLIVVLLISSLLLVTMSCSNQSQVLVKNQIYIQATDSMSDLPKLDISKLKKADYVNEKYNDTFTEKLLLKTPLGDVQLTKSGPNINKSIVTTLGRCEYSSENGDIYRVDAKGRITHYDCSERAYSTDVNSFFDENTITSEQAIEKAKDYISMFVADDMLNNLQPTPLEQVEISALTNRGEKTLYGYRIAFSPPYTEGYYWFATANVLISQNGSLLVLNNLASDIKCFENIPDGFSTVVDELVKDWMSDSDTEYSYTKGSIKVLADGRLAATGIIKPQKDGVEYQPISIIIPIE